MAVLPADGKQFDNVLLCSVWYLDRNKKRQAAVVMSVDVMHPPASYCIRLEGADTTRDTEESRLEPRPTQKPPMPAQSTPEAMAASLATPGLAHGRLSLLHVVWILMIKQEVLAIIHNAD